MLNRFSRSEMVLGKSAISKLKDSKVAVFGLGGVGGYAVEALARAGVGHLDIIDNDKINPTNINRQIIALESSVGQNKTDAFKSRILDINPECCVTKYDCFYLPETSNIFDFSSYDYVIDAVDTVKAKIDLAVRCSNLGVRIISSMGTGNKIDPMAFKVADIYSTKVCPLARVMRYELRKRGVKSLKVLYSEEEPRKQDSIALGEYLESTDDKSGNLVPGSVSFVPPVAGFILASEVIKEIIGLI